MASKAARLKKEKEKEQEAKTLGLNAFMSLLTGKKGVRKKEAAEVGKKKVSYFRGKDFLAFMRDNESYISKKCPKMMKAVFKDEYPEDEAGVDKLATFLLHYDFIEGGTRDDMPGSTDRKKWPDRLVANNTGFDPSATSFYIVRWEGSKTFQHVMMAFAVCAALGVIMFKVWPLWAKVGVWYLTMAFCTFFAFVLIIRLLAYVFLWCFGCEFWILPNLDDADLGVLDSLKPLWSFERRRDGWFMLVLRLTSMGVAGAGTYQIAQSYSASDGIEVIQHMLIDINDWGLDKFTHVPQLAGNSNVPTIEDLSKALEEDEAEEDEDADDKVEPEKKEEEDAPADDDAKAEL